MQILDISENLIHFSDRCAAAAPGGRVGRVEGWRGGLDRGLCSQLAAWFPGGAT